MPAETLILIEPTDYQEFRVASIVDCNRVFRKSLAELVEEMRRGVLKPKDDLPPDLLRRIQAGIKASPLVEEEAKSLIK